MKARNKTRLTLEEVTEHFTEWRSHKKKGERIPPSLWSEAIDLLSDYPISLITRTLHLCATDLKRHQTALPAIRNRRGSRCEMPFVEVDCEVADRSMKPSSLAVWMEMERPDGLRLRIQPANGADVLALVRRFMEV
jgi:hypothetical protein